VENAVPIETRHAAGYFKSSKESFVKKSVLMNPELPKLIYLCSFPLNALALRLLTFLLSAPLYSFPAQPAPDII
jgi:hypothetical protein